MQEELNITLLQYDIAWEDPKSNYDKIEGILTGATIETDIIILPEMFNTGFSMNASKLAEQANGRTFQWMQSIARTHSCLVIGSFITHRDGSYFNSLLAVESTGLLYQYDKRHLFHPGNEHKVYKAGSSRGTFNYKGFKIFPQICYDLRFPVWTRNDLDYDLILFIASWPEARIDHWSTLIKARAIENQAYAIGVNRLGKDENDLVYNGMSAVFSYNGASLLEAASKEGMFNISLDKSHLQYRKKLNFLSDKDDFSLKS